MSLYAQGVLFLGAAAGFRAAARAEIEKARESWWAVVDAVLDMAFGIGCSVWACVIAYKIGARWVG